MRAMTLARKPHGHSEVDLCERCHALWFDTFESLQLTAEATLTLFREVHGAAAPARAALPTHLPCPRCRATLVDTQDVQRTTRFRYWRCPRAHGRFTPFTHFLREKNFLRPLTAAQLDRLKSHIRTIRCSGCGAPVELARDMVCRYCRAPIEALDPEAVNATLSALTTEAMNHKRIDVDRLADAILGARPTSDRESRVAVDLSGTGTLVDLVGAGLAFVVDAIDDR